MGGIFLLQARVHTPSAKRRPMLGLSAAPRWRQLPAIRTALSSARQRRIVRARVHSGHGDPTSSAGGDAALHLPTIDELRAFKVKRAPLVVAGSNWVGTAVPLHVFVAAVELPWHLIAGSACYGLHAFVPSARSFRHVPCGHAWLTAANIYATPAGATFVSLLLCQL